LQTLDPALERHKFYPTSRPYATHVSNIITPL
jgi:hypothetical protein